MCLVFHPPLQEWHPTTMAGKQRIPSFPPKIATNGSEMENVKNASCALRQLRRELNDKLNNLLFVYGSIFQAKLLSLALSPYYL